MKPPDYNMDDLGRALSDLGIGRGDVVFSHSNLGLFGRPEGVSNADALCRMFADAIIGQIGPGGTLVVPTFTYSFPRKEVFDVNGSAKAMGMFSEWVRCHPEGVRSHDPCFSVAAIGGSATALTENAPENSFGPDSFFQRFHQTGGKILNFNFDAGSTFVHYVERCLHVPYRFDKTFHGKIKAGSEEREATSTIFVRYLSDGSLTAVFEPLHRLAIEKKAARTKPLGRGEVLVFTASDTYKLIEETLPHRPWFLTKAEEMGIDSPRIVPEDPA